MLGVDFDPSGTTQVLFRAIVTATGDQQCVNVSITDDVIVEGQQSITVQLDVGSASPVGQIDFNLQSSLITVVDNDGNVML